MSLPASESFAGGAGTLSNPPWVLLKQAVSRDGSGHGTTSTGGSDCIAIWNIATDSFPPDQESQVTAAATLHGNGTDYIYLVVRASTASGGSSYWFWTDGGSDTAVNKQINGGTETTLTTANTTTCVGGDIFRLRVTTVSAGVYKIQVFKNNVEIVALTTTDGSIATGQPGQGGFAGGNTPTWSSWVGAGVVTATVQKVDDSSRNHPGRGPFSKGRFYVPRIDGGITQQTGITAQLGITEADDTISSAETTAISATLSSTEANDTLAAACTTAIAASFGATEAGDTCSAAVTAAEVASLNVTEADDSCAASATAAESASLAATEADDSLSAACTEPISASAAITEANDTLSSSEVEAIVIDCAVTEGDDTCSAAISGPGFNLAVTEDDDTLSAATTIGIAADASIQEIVDSLSAAAAAVVLCDLDAIEADDLLSSVWAGGGSSASDVWNFILTDGRTAQEVLLDTNLKVDELWREHGLDIAAPLVITATSRVAGAQTQTVDTTATTTTVQRT